MTVYDRNVVECGGVSGWIALLPDHLRDLPTVAWLVSTPGRRGTVVRSLGGMREAASRLEGSCWPDEQRVAAWWRAAHAEAVALVERDPDPVVRVVDDCCVAVAFTADPVLVVDDGEVDPFTGEKIGWPYPRVYWSNGVVTDGQWRVDE